MLWINKPAILIGRNQNTLSEINLDYVKKNDILVVRRLSGGSTVYNDKGNMNFTFINYRDSADNDTKNRFKKFALPVINALQSLGVNAIFTGRNDIVIDGKNFQEMPSTFKGTSYSIMELYSMITICQNYLWYLKEMQEELSLLH